MLRQLTLVLAFASLACGRPSNAPAAPTATLSVTAAPPDAATADDPLPVASKVGFRRAWPELHAALRSGEADALIDPDLGLFVLDNPGAFVAVEHHATFAEAADRPGALRISECSLRDGPLPEYSCETGSWSAEGCVLTEPSRPGIARAHDAYVRYALEPNASVDRAVVAAIERADELIMVTVTDTSRPSRWHFGWVDEGWRLLAVDVVTPCSA